MTISTEQRRTFRAAIARSTRGSVTRRILGAFTAVLVLCAATMTWGVYAQRRAAEEAALLRSGYVPLLLSLGAALETQNLVSAQLNHVTEAKNPADVRGWLDTERRLRPLSFAAVRAAIDRGLSRRDDARARAMGVALVDNLRAVERYLDADGERFTVLFDALGRGDRARAEPARAELLGYEVEGARRLRELSREVERAMDDLTDGALARERRALALLVALIAIALGTGVALAVYVRSLLVPLARVTERARAVARGDLTPHVVVATRDELGELATTFENMVNAIGQARREVVRSERLAAVGRMAAHVTHEIRNPLSAMSLNVELLEEELSRFADAAEPRQLVTAVRGEIERLSALSTQYLSLARKPTLDTVLSDPSSLLDDLVRLVGPELERAGVRLEVERAAGLPEVRFDPTQLHQALLNLVRNAREAMPAGGVLTLGLHLGGAERELVITVDDSGEGVPDEARASLFDPFFTTKKQGTGLGLAITREIIEAHGGRITCEAHAGPGTRFCVRLPLEPLGGLEKRPGGGARDRAARRSLRENRFKARRHSTFAEASRGRARRGRSSPMHLKELLGAANRSKVVDDCTTLVEQEVKDKGGISGMAIKAAYALVNNVKPTFVRESVDHLLDDFAERLDPIYQEAKAKAKTAAEYFPDHASRVADALLAITDERAKRSKHTSLVKAYERLRNSAKNNVEVAVPRLGALITKHDI